MRIKDLTIDVRVGMDQIPTCIYNQLAASDHPLLTCRIHNEGARARHIHVSSRIDHYSSVAETTAPLEPGGERVITLRPLLLPEEMWALHSLTTASLRVHASGWPGREPLYGESFDVRLLAATAAPLATRDPSTGEWADLSFSLAAFVTPDDPAVQGFMKEVVQKHEQHRLVAYQQGPGRGVEEQVRAVFEALRTRVAYVASGELFSVNPETLLQRVRLPDETLRDGVANCADGMVLFASLLAAFGLAPALVLVPAHALVAWWAGDEGGERAPGAKGWQYLDTTMFEREFDDARQQSQQLGEGLAATFRPLDDRRWGLPRLWPLEAARARGITPIQRWQEKAGSGPIIVQPPVGAAPWRQVASDAIADWYWKGLLSWRVQEGVLRSETLGGAWKVFGTALLLGTLVEFIVVFLATPDLSVAHLFAAAGYGLVHLLNGAIFCLGLSQVVRLLVPQAQPERAAVVALLSLAGALPLGLLLSGEQLSVALRLVGEEPGRYFLRLAIADQLACESGPPECLRAWLAVVSELVVAVLYLGYGVWRGLRAAIGGAAWRRWAALGIAVAINVLVAWCILTPAYWRVMARILRGGSR